MRQCDNDTMKDLYLLEKVLIRERNLKLLAATILLAGALAFVVLMAFTNTVKLCLVCALAGCILFILGFKFLYETLTVWQVHRHPVWLQITKNPKQIVWVYSKDVQTSPYGLEVSGHAVMFFKLLDKSELSISVPRKQAHALSESLNPILPHATFGYTVERAQWYVADPALLSDS